MITTIKYLYKYFNLDSKNYIESAESIYKYASTIHNMGLKYNITKNKKSLLKLPEYFKGLLDIELRYLPLVLNDLKSITYFPEGTVVQLYVWDN